ncbi:DUF4238 domain-containing protein [Helcococcus kunzii]
MTISRNNHYVPQFYLKNWSKDNKNIFVYKTIVPDKRVPIWNLQSIKKTATMRDLYTFYDGLEESDYFEKTFGGIESDVKNIIDDILITNKVNKHHLEKLVKYLTIQLYRTPRGIKLLIDFFERTMKKFSEHEVDNLIQKSINKAKEKYKIKGKLKIRKDLEKIEFVSSFNPTRVKLNSKDNTIEISSVVVRESALNGINFLINYVYENNLKNQKWYLINALPGFSFPTSDNPVITFRKNINEINFTRGWGLENSIIMMPLSPKTILITKQGSDLNLDKSANLAFFQNTIFKIICDNADREIYCEDKNIDITKKRKRLVDREVFIHEEEKKQRSNEMNKEIINKMLV